MLYWKKRKVSIKNLGKYNGFSVAKKMREQGKSCEEFEVFIAKIPIEDLLALKLELAVKSIGGRFVGLPIWNNFRLICEDATLKYLYSISATQMDIARIIGVPKYMLRHLNKRYKTFEYFQDKKRYNDEFENFVKEDRKKI